MNKLPAKQIYLLFIIIVGIITLSVYSTYALFTFESETSEIVTIHTPKSLKITENIYEYKQITVAPNTIATTDIGIYNSFEYEVCYSVWYKIIGDEELQNKVQIIEKSNENLSTSGVLPSKKEISVTVVIINDNDEEIKVNLGTIGAQKEEGRCTLNLADDKNTILTSYKNLDILVDKILETKDEVIENESGFITYKDLTDVMTYKDTDKIYTSNKFELDNEIFSLTDAKELTIQEIVDNNKLEMKDIYICKEGKECSILYKITLIDKEEIKNDKDEIEYINYQFTKYDKLIGYSKSKNGLRKINKKDYVYYGDNPNNYIYYNCLNSDDRTTCELWRIVGYFYNEKTKKYNTKIVRNSSIGKHQFDYKIEEEENKSTNVWNESTLEKYLNEEYKLKNNYEVYLEKYIQSVERIKDTEIKITDLKIEKEKIESRITLLSLSDYLYASSCEKSKVNEYSGSCLTNNWLNNIEIENEWTLTSKEVEVPVIEEPETNQEIEENPNLEPNLENNLQPEENQNPEENEIIEEEEKQIINYVYSVGKNIIEIDVNESSEVRPTFFLKSRMLLLDGDGSFENPYVIK